MKENIFKYVNGKFVITEGYGSVKKIKEDEAKEADSSVATAPATGSGPAAAPRPAAAPTPAPAASTSSAPAGTPRPTTSPTPTTSTEPAPAASSAPAPTTPPAETASGGSSGTEEAEEILNKIGKETPMAFAFTKGIKTKADLQSLLTSVKDWAVTKNGLTVDDKKLGDISAIEGETPSSEVTPETGSASEVRTDTGETAPAPTTPAVAESKYIYPRKVKSFIKHPTLLPFKYR